MYMKGFISDMSVLELIYGDAQLGNLLKISLNYSPVMGEFYDM